MKTGLDVADLLAPPGAAVSLQAGCARTLRHVVALTAAAAGALAFHPPRGAPVVVTYRRRRPAPSNAALRRLVTLAASRGPRAVSRGHTIVLRLPLGTPARPIGMLALVGAPHALRRRALAADRLRELAAAIAAAWRQHRRASGVAAVAEVTRLLGSSGSPDDVLRAFVRATQRVIAFETASVQLLDREGGDARIRELRGERRRSPLREERRPRAATLLARVLRTAAPVRVDGAPPDERSAIAAPLEASGRVFGAIVLTAAGRRAFDAADLDALAELARPLAAALEQRRLLDANARLFEQGERHARETRALLEAGRAVTASLDPGRTMRVILEQAQAVLGVHSCSLMTLDAAGKELSSMASLDLPPELIAGVRLREGEGIAGLAFAQRKPVQSPDLFIDARVRYPELPRAAGLRSMLAAPLCVGERAVGVITVLRRDVHRFTPEEEELLQALADQAAIALEHARLYGELEAMVAERTLELDRQKRFVEVVLETLPLGVFVLDATLAVVRVNREGARLLGASTGGRSLPARLPGEAADAVEAFLRAALARGTVDVQEREIPFDGETKILRWSVAPLETTGGGPHLVVLVEDVTRAKQLERQMLLTERLTTAGRLAAGVAHELNNPLATIAGCAESLQSRLKEAGRAAEPGLTEFPRYLALIEEEAFRCKEITGSLLQFVREPGSRRAPTDINALVAKAVALLSHQSRFADGTFTTDLDPALPPLTVNEGQLRQVCLAIASNALEAMNGRGRLTIRTRQGRNREAIVEFEDEGPGIPPSIMARIFDPFFTTKPSGQGTGLGLAIAQGIVADHGGRIEVQPASERGTVFRVVLPS